MQTTEQLLAEIDEFFDALEKMPRLPPLAPLAHEILAAPNDQPLTLAWLRKTTRERMIARNYAPMAVCVARKRDAQHLTGFIAADGECLTPYIAAVPREFGRVERVRFVTKE